MDGSQTNAVARNLALGLCALVIAGCAGRGIPRIDPTGNQIFVAPETTVVSGVPVLPGVAVRQESITIAPTEIVAPVGTEVVLLSTYFGADGFPVPRQRVEWMLSPQGVGQFVALGDRDNWLALRLFRDTPRKLDNRYAIGATSPTTFNITRGTPRPEDDVTVLRGQAWITVTSPIEGTSFVTSYAPAILGWDRRQATSRIHWVDAQWVFPPPSVNPLGTKHVFTTTITRPSDNSPLAGYIVRYEIIGGPPAGLGPDGAEALEVTTDQSGQANVEIFQREPQAGTSRVGIQIIRPESATARRLILGTGVTAKTWTSPDLALRTTGPATATAGSTLVYRIDVSNPGDLPTREITVTDELPTGLTYLGSNPPATVTGRTLTWKVTGLGPRQTHMIEAQFRADTAGTINHCVSARTAEGLTARDCAATSVVAGQPGPSVPPSEQPGAGPLEVKISGPPTATVGTNVRYEVNITNRGQTPLTGLVIRDTFGAGFRHAAGENPIERDLEDLAPGATIPIIINFQVVGQGQLCHTVEVTGAGGVRAADRSCLTAIPAATPPGGTPPDTTPPRGQPAMEVTKTGPKRAKVNDKVLFVIEVKNTGDVPLTNVLVVDTYDKALDPLRAEDGYTTTPGQDNLTWQIERLDVGQTRQFRVESLAMAPMQSACNSVAVQSDQVARKTDQACVEIVPAGQAVQPPGANPQTPEATAAPQLRLTMNDLDDPATVGARVGFRVYVANFGDTVAKNVQLTVTFPDGLTPLVGNTKGPSRHSIDGQTVRFESLNELGPGDSLPPYEIPVQAVRAGTFKVTATLEADGLSRPLTVDEPTEILQ